MNRRTTNSEKTSGDNQPSSSARPLSIEGPRTSNTSVEAIPEQPKQPTDLQGLLRFAVEASQTGNATRENQFMLLDKEKKKFLTEALSSLTVNVIDELRKAIIILSNVDDVRPDCDPAEYNAALGRIADLVDNIDVANDFYKIGGFTIFGPCLNSCHIGIRWRTANLIAELTQNNPFCQERILECGLLTILLEMVDKDPSLVVQIKSLYAISCIVRGQPIALQHMEKNDGYSVLLRAMQSSVNKLQIKSAFLLSSLCNKDNSDNLKITLINMGLIEETTRLLGTNDISPELREQLLNILIGLTNNTFLPALRECRKSKLCLKSILEQWLQELTSEDKEEIDMCYQLLDTIFSDTDSVEER